MATSASVRLTRVLDLEERQGWRNRAVIGGLQAMAQRWGDDAYGEAVDPQSVRRIQALMTAYGERAADRAPLAAEIRRVLSGDMSPSAFITEAAPLPPVVAPPPSPAPAPAPKSQPPAPTPRRPEAPRERKPETTAPSRPPAEVPVPDDAPQLALGQSYVYDYRESSAEDIPAPAPKPQPRPSGKTRSERDLPASPTILQGVGPAIAETLSALGLNTVEQILFRFPTRYDDYSRWKSIADLVPGEQATVMANLWNVHERSVGINRQMVEGVLQDGTGTLTATWWNKWVKNQLTVGATLRLSGKVGLYHGKKTLDNPAFEDADTDSIATGRIAPVYRLTEGISQKKMRQIARQVVEEFAHLVSDVLPAELLERHQLPPLADALAQIHFPDTQEKLDAAKRRFAFEELFYIQLGVLQRRRELKQGVAQPFASDAELLQRYVQRLPFALTGAQVRVLDEAAADMAQPVPMTRLVQGDVGSGKTAVAAGAMWIAAANGAQSAMLAPTQILAEQHHRGITKLLGELTRTDGTPLQVALLTGRVTGSQREEVLAGLRDGSIDVVVGTTALIQEWVEFSRLGLVVVDEQHRFGVEQRGVLRTKSEVQPHLLVMSATPIPRSLALTVYGDLDVSKLDEMPPGREPVKTVLFRPTERERVYGFLRREAGDGRQGFIVYPLVAESESLDAGAATEAHERLQREVFPDLRLGLLHGQMKGSDKDAIMSAFAAGEYDVLVCTSVIEVGIDVPNATVMVIEDAERFGLAQLHQFRGRVGRGRHKGYCVLVSRSEGDSGEERLRILESTHDGFVLAEKDLVLRGPGDFLGTQQTGMPELAMAMLGNLETIEQARDAALGYFEQDPTLAQQPQLAARVERFWSGQGDIS